MINLIVGQPGGGKSYEAVAFHVLPALKQGRKVITNLPLHIEAFRALDPRYVDLIVLKHSNIEKEVENFKWNMFARCFDRFKSKVVHRPFASIEDYGDEWRHPTKGSGALYVIDECHKCLPRAGTDKLVDEWFAEHRHELCDVLLITQSYGKVCKNITDSVQVLYRVKKATAFGSNTSYIRKVQDGVGGEVVNTGIRKYEPQYFPLYKSHTKSSEAGQELSATDIVPFWRRWPVMGAGLCALVLVGLLLSGKTLNPMSSAQASTVAAAAAVRPIVVASHLPPPPPPPVQLASVEQSKATSQISNKIASHPFEGLTIHITGFISSSTRWRYTFMADQNGQPAFTILQAHLEESGYIIQKLSPCSAKIIYQEKIAFYAVCDVARVGTGLAGA